MAIIFGINPDTYAGRYSGSSPITVEEAATNGWNQKVAVRVYKNTADQPFTGGSNEVTWFNNGRMVCISVSNTYHYPAITSGTYDALFNAMFDRMLGLSFGSGNPNEVQFILQHEVGRNSKFGLSDVTNATAQTTGPVYAAALTHVHSLYIARPLFATVGHKVKFVLSGTNDDFSSGRMAYYWPGSGIVDYIAIDQYNWSTTPSNPVSSFNLGRWQSNTFAALAASGMAYAQTHGNLPVIFPEVAVVEVPAGTTGAGVNDTAKKWWENAGTYVASQPIIKGVWAWQPDPAATAGTIALTESFDKTSYPNKHAGLQNFITAVSGTALGATGGTGSRPSNPANLVCVSSADGRSVTGTWDANPVGDSITGWDAYHAAGLSQTTLTKDTATPISATPRSYLWTGLTPGAGYTFAVAADNATGRSGFSNQVSLTTSVPGGTNHSPNIGGITATPTSSDGLTQSLVCTATDPDSNPLTYTWTVSGPGFNPPQQTGATISVTFPGPAPYTATVVVSDGTLSTTGSIPVIISSGAGTQNYSFLLPQPGDMRLWGPVLRSALNSVDTTINNLILYDTKANLINYDPAGYPPTTEYVCTDVEQTFITDGTQWLVLARQPSMGSTGLTTGEATMRRFDCTDFVVTNTGIIRLTYFDPIKTEPITNLRIITGSTAASGLTLAKLGVYSVNATTGDLTLVASTADDHTTWNGAGTGSALTRPLLATWQKTRGTRYAIGNLAVGTTPPTFQGKNGPTNTSEMGQDPRLCATLSGQTDIPSTITAASLSNTSNAVYIVTVP